MFCEIFYDYLLLFFFFKQKTAYEMRISDWSSDVCSSDLAHVPSAHSHPPAVVVCPPPQRSAGARVQASRYSPSNYNYGQWRAPPAHSVLVSQTLPTSALQDLPPERHADLP